MKRFLQVLLILFLFQTQAKASHVMGGEITYRYLGGLKYEITVKFYRDCRGIPLDSVHGEMKASSKIKTLSFTKVSIRDVSNYCMKNSNPCGKANTIGAGLGIEEHLFKDTVDFNKADSSLKKYCYIAFGAGQCCRSGAITTGGGGNNFWVYSSLNICLAPNNSSPILTSIPNNFLCCNQPYFYNMGAVDSLDRDSLTYEWDDPMQDWNTKTSWSGGKSSSSPFTDYWPKGYNKSKGPNPTTNPPIGTSLERQSGTLIFMPTDCSESTIASIKVVEWRKDSTGKYNVIGEIKRDMQYFVQTCPDNNPPISTNNVFNFSICPNQKLCFDVTFDDKQFIPPPPAKPNPPDTVSLSWNYGIGKGAKFTITNPNARLQTGQFCWTPKESDASDLPYTFVVTARDNTCSINGISVRPFTVKVGYKAKATWTKKYIKNGLYEIKAKPEKGFKGTPQYYWEILDSTFKICDTAYYFHPSGRINSNKQMDSVQFYSGGKYILHFRINNPPYNCPTDYFDTLKVAAVTPILRISPTSLQEKWVCKNTVDTIFPILRNVKKPVKFKWSSSSADTLPYLIIDNKKDSTYRVDVYDGAGYHQFATWKFYTYKEPILAIGKDILACVGDTILLKATVSNFKDTVFWNWKFKGQKISINPQIKVVTPGFYSLEIYDSNHCVSKMDSIKVSNMVVNADAGRDRGICKGDTAILNAKGLDTTDGKKGKYFWYINSLSNLIDSGSLVTYKFKTDNTMIVELLQTKGSLTCADLDTLKVSFRPLPQITLKNGSICQNETELDLHTLILKPTNSYTGIVSWQLLKTLQKPSGADNSITDLVYDKDNTSSDHYYLKVDKSIIDLKTKFMDSVILGLTFKDEFGCQNSSTNGATIVIRSNVDVVFNTNEQKRCYGDSVIYISNDYGVNYYGGKWFTNNDSSNYLKWPQGNIVQLSEKLGTKSLNAKGGKYMLKYTLENNKCLSSKNAILTIIPYPNIVWTQTDQGDSVVLTDKSTNAERREWYINSKKMSEATSLTVSKSDAKIKVIVLKVFNTNCETDSVIVPKITFGINKINPQKFVIYPNPVNQILTIETNNSKPFQIKILNALGQIILTKLMDLPKDTIDIAQLCEGVYTLEIIVDDTISRLRFIKK